MEAEEPGCATSSFRVLPDTCVELFINYKGSQQTIRAGCSLTKRPNCFIVSRMSRYMDVDGHGDSGSVTVCFFPGAAAHFFPIAMHEISDGVTDLYDLWKNASEIEDLICAATDNSERVSMIQKWLSQHLKKKQKTDKTIERWLWQVNYFKGQLSVDELSRKVNISQRQLGRRFNQTVGLSPKEFSRVTRFIHSLTQLKKYPALSLTEIAYESGYYDQAHFIHDYKSYSGLTPGELVSSTNILY
jgi:AraC-like DNA-binding protein